MCFIKKSWAGILLCLVFSVPSFYLGKLFPVVGGPVFAILIGMIANLLIKDKDVFMGGVSFTSKKILQLAVILLGFGMNLSAVAQVGLTSLPIIIATISTSLILSFILCKLLKMPSKISTLVGVGSSICGGSAIAATAPVIDADDEEIAQSISVIFLFNIIAALIFPTLGGLLGLSNEGFGLFAGTAINDTSSVTAAASTWDTLHSTNGAVLDNATIVKLTRTLAIIPITLVLSFVRTKKEKKHNNDGKSNVSFTKIFPFFILFFILASVITTIALNFGVSAKVFMPLKELSKFFIIMAMAAIGFNTNIVHLIKSGSKPILMGFCCWVAITAVSLIMQHFMGIW